MESNQKEVSEHTENHISFKELSGFELAKVIADESFILTDEVGSFLAKKSFSEKIQLVNFVIDSWGDSVIVVNKMHNLGKNKDGSPKYAIGYNPQATIDALNIVFGHGCFKYELATEYGTMGLKTSVQTSSYKCIAYIKATLTENNVVH